MSPTIDERVERVVGMGLLGPGKRLGLEWWTRMERMLGKSLPRPYLHETEAAGELARAIGARAFTVGAHVFAPRGALRADSSDSAALLAHELTHVARNAEMPSRNTVAKRETGESRPTLDPEREARIVESRARAPGTRPTGPNPFDAEALADRVYMLMSRELRLDHERSVGPRGRD